MTVTLPQNPQPLLALTRVAGLLLPLALHLDQCGLPGRLDGQFVITVPTGGSWPS